MCYNLEEYPHILVDGASTVEVRYAPTEVEHFMSSLSFFDRSSGWFEERGLFWFHEFLSLLFGTGVFALIAILAVFLVSRIPRQKPMVGVGVILDTLLVYLFVDATIWRTGLPAGPAFPSMVTLLGVGLFFVTWWTWEKKG